MGRETEERIGPWSPELEVGRGTRSTQAGTETLGKELASADPSLALLGEPQTSEPPTRLWKQHCSPIRYSRLLARVCVCVCVCMCVHMHSFKRGGGGTTRETDVKGGRT